MKRRYLVCFVWVAMSLLAGSLRAEPTVLKASKDSFGRSNQPHCNSGASPILYIAQAPNIRTIIGFDLSVVTNRILNATFRFQQKNSADQEIALTVAPMVQTTNNAAWKEGGGSLGAIGQNAQLGESCYGWCGYPDTQWEDASGAPVTDLGSPQLWGTPLVSNEAQSWEDGQWVEIPIKNIHLLETIRTSNDPILTLGLWGTSGSGMYAIASKESGNAPELVLVLQETKKRKLNIEQFQGNQAH